MIGSWVCDAGSGTLNSLGFRSPSVKWEDWSVISLLPIPREGRGPACCMISKSWLHIGLWYQNGNHRTRLFKWLRFQADVMSWRRTWMICSVIDELYRLFKRSWAKQTWGHLPSLALQLCATCPYASRKHYFLGREWEAQYQYILFLMALFLWKITWSSFIRMVPDEKKTWLTALKHWTKLPTVSALKELTVYEARRGRKFLKKCSWWDS